MPYVYTGKTDDYGYDKIGYKEVELPDELDDRYYLIKEYAYKHKDIEYWINIAKEIIKEYGSINFYCDHARPDYISKLKVNGIRAINARKEVLEGISTVATLLKTNKLLILEDNVNIFKNEIYNYVWSKGKDEPIKQNYDVLDSLRYAIYSDMKLSGNGFNRTKYGI